MAHRSMEVRELCVLCDRRSEPRSECPRCHEPRCHEHALASDALCPSCTREFNASISPERARLWKERQRAVRWGLTHGGSSWIAGGACIAVGVCLVVGASSPMLALCGAATVASWLFLRGQPDRAIHRIERRIERKRLAFLTTPPDAGARRLLVAGRRRLEIDRP